MTESEKKLKELMHQTIERKATDLHLSAYAIPMLRANSHLQEMSSQMLEADEVKEMAYSIMQPQQKELFEQVHTLDLALSFDNERFRINIFKERGNVAMALRRLDNKIHSLKELNLPDQLSQLANMRDGLVIVTGPTGSGKSTTLATIIDQINKTRSCHILTIEDPIEYIHKNRKSLVRQRELHKDVASFSQAVWSAMREDPDVILVGEMRDKETILAAITAAETGHLVFSTLHTPDAPGAIDRISGIFPEDEQIAIRKQLSMVLHAVVAQRLLPRLKGDGLIPATEILWVNSAIAHLIRSWNPQQIYSFMESGTKEGMLTMEKSLAQLVAKKMIDKEVAQIMARDPQILEDQIRSLSSQPYLSEGVH